MPIVDSTKVWLFYAFPQSGGYGGNRGYEDEATQRYIYDQNVQYNKQVQAGDFAVICTNERALGAARIEVIEADDSAEKERKVCPICELQALGPRKTRQFKWRCKRDHEFDQPLIKNYPCVRYAAHYGETFQEFPEFITLQMAKSWAVNPSHQLSVRPISLQVAYSIIGPFIEYIDRHYEFEISWPKSKNTAGAAFTADAYVPTDEDLRAEILRSIKQRHGQSTFRKHLEQRDGRSCMISGSVVMEVLEAAHISPYRGEVDHHVENGLLLRADLHTLFDLDLLGVNPDTLEIRLARPLLQSEYAVFEGNQLRCDSNSRPSLVALRRRWEQFTDKRFADDAKKA